MATPPSYAIDQFLGERAFIGLGLFNEDEGCRVEKMKSHIMYCLGALIDVVETGQNEVFPEHLVFFKGVANVCSDFVEKSRDQRDVPKRPSIAKQLIQSPFLYSAPDSHVGDKMLRRRNIWHPLLWASICDAESDDTFRSLINPSSITYRHPVDGASVAHYASATCFNNVKVLEYILESLPSAMSRRDAFGNLPLHFAAGFSSSIENFRYLLSVYPEALTLKGRQQWLPIHVLVSRIDRDNLDILKLMLSSMDADLLLERDADGNTPLHLSWGDGSPNDIAICSHVLRANPKAVTIYNNSGKSPLQSFLSPRLFSPLPNDEEVLAEHLTYFKELLEASLQYSTHTPPHHVLMTCSGPQQYTPLHWACSFANPYTHPRVSTVTLMTAIISSLLDACPEAAAAQAAGNRTPFDLFLDFVWLNGGRQFVPAIRGPGVQPIPLTNFEACVRAFIAAYESTGTMERFRDTFSDPLLAAAKSWPLPLVTLIYESFPRSRLQEQNNNILAASASNAHDDVVTYLAQKYPNATRFPLTTRDATPCLSAVLNTYFIGAVRIFRLDPTVAAIPDSRGYTPLFALLAVGNSNMFLSPPPPEENFDNLHLEKDLCVAAVDLFYMLLKAAPQVVRFVTNVDQKTVLDVAREKSIPVPFLRALHRAAPDLYPDEYRKLNYEARRGALYLLHIPLSTVAFRDVDDAFRVWRRLRERGMMDMIIDIVSFL